MKKYKLVVFVPYEFTDKLIESMGNAGAGEIGNYRFCSFVTRGEGRFIPGIHANPYIGKSGELEKVVEDRVEMICPEDKLSKIILEMKKVHPYEEVAYDIYKLEDF